MPADHAPPTERSTFDLVDEATDLLARRLAISIIDNDIRVSDHDERDREFARLDATVLEALVGWRIDHLNYHSHEHFHGRAHGGTTTRKRRRRRRR